MFVRTVRQALLIIGIGALVGMTVNLIAPWRIAWIGAERVLAAAPDSGPAARADTGTVVEPLSITLAQARELHASGATFVDARPSYEFDEGHIAGAVNVPWEEIEYFQGTIERLPLDSAIVVYCAGQGCNLSIHLGDELAKRGFRQMRVFYGGWNEWTAANLPVEKPAGEGAPQ